MNCLKVISVENEYGKMRLWLLSSIISFVYFSIFYIIFRTFVSPVTLSDYGLAFLTLSLAIVPPTHLLLHCLPLWLTGRKAIFGFRKGQWPYIFYSSKQPLSKQISLISTGAPAFLLTSISIVAAFIFPHLVHYIAMMSALNIGICVYDFMNFQQLKNAPTGSVIEENRDGFYVLYPSMDNK